MTAPARAHTARQLQGYAMVGGSFLIMGSIGALVDYATRPGEHVARAAHGHRRRGAGRGLRAPPAAGRPAHAGRAAAPARSWASWTRLALLFFFVALRTTSVAIGMFLAFTAPVWVALMAPRVLHTRTEPVVYVAVAIALAGLAMILVPSLSGQGVRVSALGPLPGAGSGLGVCDVPDDRQRPVATAA